jgi:medium-chain acyl-CoA synthetase
MMSHYYDQELQRPEAFNFATDVVDYWARSSEAKWAMRWVSADLQQQRQLSFQHFSQQSNRLAALLRNKLGISSGERLLIIVPRVPIWWEIATACIRCGIVVCPATTLLVDKDIEYRANRSRASVFVGDQTSVQKLLKVKSNCPDVQHVIQIGDESVPNGVQSLNELLRSISDDAKYDGPQPNVKDTSMIYL